MDRPSDFCPGGGKFKSYQIQICGLHQLVRYPRIPQSSRSKSPALKSCPQKKGLCLKIYLRKPKKPNSALRKLCRVRLSTGRRISAYIPGEGHNLQEFNSVLIRGGRAKDLPGVRYHVIRGKYDCLGLIKRTTSRSKYGARKP